MLSFDDQCNLYFKGVSEDKIAFVEVKIFGKAITDILNQELAISSDRIYIKYEEVEYWR